MLEVLVAWKPISIVKRGKKRCLKCKSRTTELLLWFCHCSKGRTGCPEALRGIQPSLDLLTVLVCLVRLIPISLTSVRGYSKIQTSVTLNLSVLCLLFAVTVRTRISCDF